MSNKTRNSGTCSGALKQIVQRYKTCPPINGVILKTQEQANLRRAIAVAVRSTNHHGNMHRHQCHIGAVRLEEFKVKLLRAHDLIDETKDFVGLHQVVEDVAVRCDFIGHLACYDVALRIALYFEKKGRSGYLPNKVYLHAGAYKGARTLKPNLRNNTTQDKLKLSPCFRSLSSYLVENLLCVFKDRLLDTSISQEDLDFLAPCTQSKNSRSSC